MDDQLFARFAPMLRDMDDEQLAREIADPNQLLIDSARAGGRKLDIAYAPFEHMNTAARIAIVGLTPGRQQMRNALLEARRSLRAGKDERQAMADAKVFASFSGPMRANLVALLDGVGVNGLLKIPSTATLWTKDAHLVHFTSAMRYPVFVDGANFSGAPSITTTPLLRTHLMKWFAGEIAALPDALFVPLGPKVGAAVEHAARQLGIDESRILSGLPHPSGANQERIAFFLGRKPRAELSAKVEPERLLAARAQVCSKIERLTGRRA